MELRRRITAAVLQMATDPDGREALALVGSTAFVPLDEAAFDAVARGWSGLLAVPR